MDRSKKIMVVVAASGAIAAAWLAGVGPAAADTTPDKLAPTHHQIKADLSESEILKVWPPARKRGSVHFANCSDAYAARDGNGKIRLDGWIPDEMETVPGKRFTKDEQQIRVLRGGIDKFPDYISHAVESRSLLTPFWW